jgi:hypothetical protein
MLHDKKMKQFLAAAATVLVLTIVASDARAQATSKRHVDVTVTDPRGRFVTGLEEKNFEVVENGVRRAITDFSDVDSSIALAIVGDGPLPDVGPLGPQDQLIQAASVSDAVRRLRDSKNPRKVIVSLTTTNRQAVPAGIEILQTTRADLFKAVIELHNQYRLEFESSAPSAPIAIMLSPPAGLPHLELNWK